MTFRLPIADARGFSSNPDVAQSVRLPVAWDQGQFVRGFGEITRRPAGTVGPWSHEAAFADLARTLLFDNAPIEAFNRKFPDLSVLKIRKRAWMALPDSSALIDVDVALQVAPQGARRRNYPRRGQFSMVEISHAVAQAAALPVRVRSAGRSVDPVRLLMAGSPLASRFAFHTSASESSTAGIVRAGRTTVVLEAPGQIPCDANNFRSEQLSVSGINLVSFDVRVDGGGDVRCHVLWDQSGSKGNRKKIRELRIHILRLHSIHELMRHLASSVVTSSKAEISDAEGTPGFDALQQTLLSCVRTVLSRERPGGARPEAILDTAFFAQNFNERNLTNLLDRTISAMRPKVRNAIVAFHESEEQRQRDNAEADLQRQLQQKPTVIVERLEFVTKYVVSGNIGAVGDNAQARNNVIGGAPTDFLIGETKISRELLMAELRALRESLVVSNQANVDEDVRAVASAELELRNGQDSAATNSLRKVANWAVDAATAIGAGVAATAIAAASGLA